MIVKTALRQLFHTTLNKFGINLKNKYHTIFTFEFPPVLKVFFIFINLKNYYTYKNLRTFLMCCIFRNFSKQILWYTLNERLNQLFRYCQFSHKQFPCSNFKKGCFTVKFKINRNKFFINCIFNYINVILELKGNRVRKIFSI